MGYDANNSLSLAYNGSPPGAAAEAPSSPDRSSAQRPASRPATCPWGCGSAPHPGLFRTGCPGPALKDGTHSALVQAGSLPSQGEAAAVLAERQAEIERDLGGTETLSRIHRDAVRDLLRLELVGDYLFARLLEGGPLTGKGRTRAATLTYLQVLDRLHRLRQMVGLQRVALPINPLAAVRDAVAAANRPKEDA